jgi:hypothetical protein
MEISKWRVSFPDSSPLIRQFTIIFPGNGLVREYAGPAIPVIIGCNYSA